MALVIQSDRFQKIKDTTSPKIGPGYYEEEDKYAKIQKNTTAFNQKSERVCEFIYIKNKDQPGPGAYDPAAQEFNDKALTTEFDKDGFRIIEVPKLTSVFKSKIQRMKQKSQHNTPGPGQYIVIQQKPIIKQEKIQHNNIIDALRQTNEYQQIPSIPGKKEQYGYLENDFKQVEVNKPEEVLFTGLKNDQIGPGQYENQNFFEVQKEKRYSYPKEKRFRETEKAFRMNEEVGPGKYQPGYTKKQLHDMNSSMGFSSKTVRVWDQRPGQIYNQFINEAHKRQVRQQFGSEIEDTDLMFEYVENNVPGPGYYHNESTASSIKTQQRPKKYQFFGESKTRFKEKQKEYNIGPGDYKIQDVKAKIIKNKIQPPFAGVCNRFEKKIQNINPGPGTYDANDKMIDRIEKMTQKAGNANFGSKMEKNKQFVDMEVFIIFQETPGPGYYVNPDIIAFKNYQEVIDCKQSHMFQSNIQRNLYAEKKGKQPNFFTYDPQNFTLKKQVEIGENYIQKAPFLTNQERLKQQQKRELEQIQIPHADNLQEYFNQQQQTQIPFQSIVIFQQKEQRFQYERQQKMQNKIGPGQYQTTNPEQWNKKTFNILYSDL